MQEAAATARTGETRKRLELLKLRHSKQRNSQLMNTPSAKGHEPGSARNGMMGSAATKERKCHPWGETQRIMKKAGSAQEVKRKKKFPSFSFPLQVSGLPLDPLFGRTTRSAGNLET